MPLENNFCEIFTVKPGPWGARLEFGINDEKQGNVFHTRVYMSIEHLKAMAYILARQILKFEESIGIEVPMPEVILKESINSNKEQWNTFWYGWKKQQPFGASTIPLDGKAEEIVPTHSAPL